MLTRLQKGQASKAGSQHRQQTSALHGRHQTLRILQRCRASKRSHTAQAVPASLDLEGYELIVVGSGNGACAFLSKYLQATQGQEQRRVLVLEEGQDFLRTSNITHQANWTRSYAEESIYKLHAATTGPNAGNKPIISGRAVTQGGGGSINYALIHESSDWLAEQLGAGGAYSPDYWDTLKQQLGVMFQRQDPGPNRTPVAQALWQALTDPTQGGSSFQDVPGCKETGWIPQYIDGAAAGKALGRVYTFNMQFDDFGQRTNSGVSLVAGGRAWREDSRIDLWTNARVEALQFDGASKASKGGPPKVPCTGLTVRRLGPRETVQHITFDPRATTVILAAGSSTPRLLLPHKGTLQNDAIGTRVNDHILLPAGFYGLRQTNDQPQVSPKDQYLPLFPEQEVTVKVPAAGSNGGSNGSSNGGSSGGSNSGSNSGSGGDGVSVTVCYDFFAGPVSDLSYYLSHLFVSLWMPNWLKTACLNSPGLFLALKRATALLIESSQFFVNLKYGLLTGGRQLPPLNVITGTTKFNIFYEGQYEPQVPGRSGSSTRIVLKCFADSPDGSCSSSDVTTTPDGQVATATLAPLMRTLDVVGERPWGVVQWLLKLLLGLPYDSKSERDIKEYVGRYAESHLLTEQHMSGGCVLGHAAEDGSAGAHTVGLVKGSANVVVADLSAVPLPRLSPQMTAYLLGYHIATQRYQQQPAAALAVGREETAAAVAREEAAAAAGEAAVAQMAAVQQQRR